MAAPCGPILDRAKKRCQGKWAVRPGSFQVRARATIIRLCFRLYAATRATVAEPNPIKVKLSSRRDLHGPSMPGSSSIQRYVRRQRRSTPALALLSSLGSGRRPPSSWCMNHSRHGAGAERYALRGPHLPSYSAPTFFTYSRPPSSSRRTAASTPHAPCSWPTVLGVTAGR